MVPRSSLSRYFKLLVLTGVLSVSLKNGNQIVSSRVNKRLCFLSFILINSLQVIASYLLYRADSNEYSATSQEIEHMQKLSGCYIHILTHTWMYFHQTELLTIVKMITTCHMKFSSTSREVQRNYRIFVAYNVFYLLNGSILMLVIGFEYNFEILGSISAAVISLEINFLVSTLILSFYSSLVSEVQRIVEQINGRLEKMVVRGETSQRNHFEIHELLKIRNELLVLCVKDISFCLGVPLILISVFVLLSVAHITITCLWNFNLNMTWIGIALNLGGNFYLIIPKMLLYVRVFGCNRLRNEVSTFPSSVVFYRKDNL